MNALPRYLVGVSLKMYFSHARTVQWCRTVADMVRSHPAVVNGIAELFVIPGYLSVFAAHEILGEMALVGAQDLSTEDSGAFTGEVSGSQIAEFGCRVVEVGHAERRRLFGDTDDVVRAKTAAALRNGLIPVLCVGEANEGDSAEAAHECIRQLDDALASARAAGHGGRIIVAYEPYWSIGAADSAPPRHIRAVCANLGKHVRMLSDYPDSAVIYGGSARPGLLTAIGDAVDGVFLGRFGYDPAAIAAILDETCALHSSLRDPL